MKRYYMMRICKGCEEQKMISLLGYCKECENKEHDMRDYPITLKEAKRIAKARIGRLPRPGYSVVVGGVFNGLPPTRRWDYQLSLVNSAGRFWLLAWQRPFSNPDLSNFQSIESEKDGRE